MSNTPEDIAIIDTIKQFSSQLERQLDEILSFDALSGESIRPKVLVEAMRYCALGGGKRIRPFLYAHTAELFGIPASQCLKAACALELVHCYSLIHDDLPAMDDDDMRRGKPTAHLAFNEATAILAGDSLLTLAFDVLADPSSHAMANVRAELVLGLARAAGIGGMAGGQMLDLQAETQEIDLQGVQTLQEMKTGALLRFACEAGAMHAEADPMQVSQLRKFGTLLGAAYQLQDDILDVTADAQTLGKATQKDAQAGKGTLISLMGMQAAQKHLSDLTSNALDILAPFGERGDKLRQLTKYMAQRSY